MRKNDESRYGFYRTVNNIRRWMGWYVVGGDNDGSIGDVSRKCLVSRLPPTRAARNQVPFMIGYQVCLSYPFLSEIYRFIPCGGRG